jgi:DNA-binding MarR family transcriptional regulator
MKSNRSIKIYHQLQDITRKLASQKHHVTQQTVDQELGEVLAFIARQSKCTAKDLANFLKITAPSVTVKINKLVAAGLIKKTLDPKDRRSFLLSLTESGNQQLNQLDETADQFAAVLFSKFSKKQKKELEKFLAIIEEQIDKQS